MKQALDEAGIRTPRHVAAHSVAAVWEAAELIGFPIILKPIDGAGSADTYRINDATNSGRCCRAFGTCSRSAWRNSSKARNTPSTPLR